MGRVDAHIHMGYYPRLGSEDLAYYSPRRIVGILDRCDVDEFVVSSTSSQIDEISFRDIIREAEEMKLRAGSRAHIFFWLSGRLYDEDRSMGWLSSGVFEGVKFHERETPWLGCRKSELKNILKRLSDLNLPVQFHTGDDDGCRPLDLMELAKEFPSVRFDFSHCRQMPASARVVAECSNVFVDTAYLAASQMGELKEYDWKGRLMYGSDLPVWQAHENVSLTKAYRANILAFNRAAGGPCKKAFNRFLHGKDYDYDE